MLKSFIISFKLKNTYLINSIIYSIKQLPFIKNVLPSSLYTSKGLKVFGIIISILIEIVSIFLGKLLYIPAMILSAIEFMKTGKSDTFIHIFTFLTISGALFNTYMFNPTKDKYYAMILMNMDARKYTLSNYYYSMIKVIIGFLPFTILFGLISELSMWMCLIMPLFVVMVKMIVSNYTLRKYIRYGKATNENLPGKILWIATAILLALAYGPPFVGVALNQTIFLILFIASLIGGICSFNYINHFGKYRNMYKEILTPNNVFIIKSQTETIRNNTLKQIELNDKFTSNKEGFTYFHDLFVKRHRKLLTGSAKKTAMFNILIIIIVLIITMLNPEFKVNINKTILIYLPYFVFIMYMINKGTVITQAMFMNCDHSMLTYRFFKKPSVILNIFKERLKTLISINLIPAIIIATGLPIILLITGGTNNPLNYFILFISIIAMSIFFSVHYLVMYYLLQPYNINIEMKSSTYKVMQFITYVVCWTMINLRIPIISFGVVTVIFSIAYCIISLFLVYKFAPKTFKLRI